MAENCGPGSETARDFWDWLLRKTGPAITIQLDGKLDPEAAREHNRATIVEELARKSGAAAE